MKNSLVAACVGAVLFAAGPAANAQEGLEQVVVSSMRMSDPMPSVTYTKRADFLITRVRVTCDTRDATQRRNELKSTLRNMIEAAAHTPTLSLGVGADTINSLEEKGFDELIAPDTRADTSRADIVIRTAISAADTFDGATARIRAFIDKTPKVGRSEIIATNNWDLTIVGPEQYRDELIRRIVASAKHASDLFGSGYAVDVGGLERRVEWVQRGQLDLAMFISYSLEVKPR